jgi:hypothetical protein
MIFFSSMRLVAWRVIIWTLETKDIFIEFVLSLNFYKKQ